MPLLVTYDGRPVKFHRRVRDGLLLTFYSPRPGDRGARLFVTQAAWRLRSRTTFYQSDSMPDVRALAARYSVDS